ncbi:LacI family DNA-binding transcriptional regulator [Paenibacillus lautus]|uniref:LacI family DNA-binding transcriptional regulator n=1 Tax=Paenibacillus lautus TaxID=1401 RepID=UPI002DBCE2FA|nr:LacI family DNA-binding transcriptional regulator [Paenibacillus lautus]MEC0202794.1 LacI family DNA-binding transcriptional regulator [Paenibacillus lautus]
MAKATIKQVAAAAEVSTATVSRVLNDSDYVSDEIKERVMAAVNQLNYRPSAIARSLKQDRTYMIGIVVPDISNPYFMGISRGIEDIVGKEGFQLIFCSSDENPDKERRLLKLMQEKRVDAVVLATSGGNDPAIQQLADSKMPIVLVDRKPDSPEAGLSLDLVAEDNTEGASRLTRKLLEDGHTAIGVVNGPTRSSTGRERLDGVRKAMEEYGLNEEPMVYNGDFSTEDGIRAVRHFLSSERRPTAIISLNNRMSLGVLLEIVRSGLKMPADMAVASFGEVEAGPLLRESGLYYMEQHPYDMGIKAGEILLSRIREEAPLSEPEIEIYSNEVKQLN